MAQLIKKFIGDNQVGAAKIRLENASSLKGRNAGDSADVNIVRINAADQIEFQGTFVPSVASTHNIGDSSLPYQTIYVNEIYNANGCGAVFIDVFNQKIKDAVGNNIIDCSSGINPYLIDQNGANAVNWGDPNALILLPNVGGIARGIDFREDTANGTNRVRVKAPAALGGDVNFTLPNSNGSSGQVLQTDGSGNTSWVTPAAGPGTPNKEVFTLSAGDITNGYIDLANVATTNTIDLLVKNAGVMIEGASHDYTVNYTGGAGGNTRITWVNDLATALAAGDVLQVMYQY